MHKESIERWAHEHTFGQDLKKTGERKTMIVIALTGAMMVAEIVAGIIFGSMALLADGLHMASHASALTVTALAYLYTRRHARDARFCFGTGKVNSLAAFASAIMLGIFALVMAWESGKRFFFPVSIGYNQAIIVAVLGLAVNGLSLVILGEGKEHRHPYHAHDHNDHPHEHTASRGHQPPGQGGKPHAHGDHSLWAAYLHVLADALTSVFAIFALLGAKYWGFIWLDPFMGIVGAALVTRWSFSLIRVAAHVLLDMQAPQEIREEIRRVIESQGDARVSDLHVWSIGPGIYAAEIAVISSLPLPPGAYDVLLPKDIGLVHVTIETSACESQHSVPCEHEPSR